MPDSLAGKRLAIYARYSSDPQSAASIDDQCRRCSDGIARMGGDPATAAIYSDRAVSGTIRSRPGLDALMRAVEAGDVDAIIVEDVSRLSRDIADAATIFKQLAFRKVPLIGVSDGIDTSQRGAKITFALRSALADVYVDDCRDKTLRGLEGKALNDLSTGGCPYGYSSKAIADSRGKVTGYQVDIDAQRAEVVRDIFEQYRAGRSLGQIANALNEAKVASPREGTQHRNKGWGASTIRAMLMNAKFAGVWRFKQTEWQRVPGTRQRRPLRRPASDVITRLRPDLAIVDQATWDEVHARLAAVRRKYTQHADGRPKGVASAGRATPYLFSGLLVCGVCGGAMTISRGTSAAYFGCATARKKGVCINKLSVREDLSKRVLLGAVRERLMSDAGIMYVRKRIAVALGDLGRKATAEVSERRERLGRTEARIKGLVAFIADGDRSPYIVEALRDLETQAKHEKGEIAAIERMARQPVKLPSVDEVLALVFDLEARFEQDVTGARELLRRLFKDGAIRLVPEEGVYTAHSELLPLVLLDEAERAAEKRTTRNPGSDSASFSFRSGGPHVELLAFGDVQVEFCFNARP